jgi:hypothetical protein
VDVNLNLFADARLTRIADDKFIVKDSNTVVYIQEPFKDKPEIQAFILEKCLAFLPKSIGESSSPIKVGSRQFKWVPVDVEQEGSLFSKISSLVSSFIFPVSNQGINRYKLAEIETQEGRVVAAGDPGKLQQETERLSSVGLLLQGFEMREIEQGVRVRLPMPTAEQLLYAARFSNPYTFLAGMAFQRYEKDFTNKDAMVAYPANCDMCLVEMDRDLVLQYKKGADPALHSATIQHYYDWLLQEHGKEKIHYIEHLYGLDFARMVSNGEPLTPEHVYRVNMGLTNLEGQDVQAFYDRLKQFAQQAEFLVPETDLAQAFLSKSLLFEGEQAALHQAERRAVLGAISAFKGTAAVTVKDFLYWSKGINLNQSFIMDLPIHQVEQLVSIFALQPGERARALTGREIFESVLGWYNSGELQEYKPWLDQQQLMQAIAEYEESDNVEAFYELLAFVMVKMHLVREHPTEGYRVGALIPVPKSAGGVQQWYKISSCVSNGYGNFSFTLEGLGKDSTLPAMKLYRSTAASSYCMHGQGSLRSDINPLNSPGYLGRGLGDAYESLFFTQRSIPVWAAYAVHAQNKLAALDHTSDLALAQSIASSLIQANNALENEHKRPFKVLSLRQLIRKHDAILVDMLSKEGRLTSSLFSSETDLAQFGHTLDILKTKYILSNSNVAKAEQKRDAKVLLELLRQFAAYDLKPGQRAALIELTSDLESHAIRDGAALKAEAANEMEQFKMEIFNELKLYEARYFESLRSGSEIELFEILAQWTATLEAYAMEKKEHPSQKKADDLVILGHSLGGSLAQLHAHHFLTARHRVPLPNQTLKMYSFDGPGINREENDEFKKFGNTHAQLIKDMHIGFEVHHSQESGDLIAFGGEEHLGATFDQKEAEKVESWLRFTGEVFERKAQAAYATIAQSASAHATRFRLGGENDYQKTFYPSIFQGVIDKGGELGALSMETVAESLRQKTWHVDYFNSPATEKIRSSSLNTILYFLMNDKESSPKGEHLFDNRGVLAVNEAGVVSIPVK